MLVEDLLLVAAAHLYAQGSKRLIIRIGVFFRITVCVNKPYVNADAPGLQLHTEAGCCSYTEAE
jgi:hypothetical protein